MDEEEIDMTSLDMWGEWDAACWKAFEALCAADNIRRHPQPDLSGNLAEERAA